MEWEERGMRGSGTDLVISVSAYGTWGIWTQPYAIVKGLSDMYGEVL